MLVNTVEKNRNKYTIKHYSDANKAWLKQNIIGHPSTDDYIDYVQKNLIAPSPRATYYGLKIY